MLDIASGFRARSRMGARTRRCDAVANSEIYGPVMTLEFVGDEQLRRELEVVYERWRLKRLKKSSVVETEQEESVATSSSTSRLASVPEKVN